MFPDTRDHRPVPYPSVATRPSWNADRTGGFQHIVSPLGAGGYSLLLNGLTLSRGLEQHGIDRFPFAPSIVGVL